MSVEVRPHTQLRVVIAEKIVSSSRYLRATKWDVDKAIVRLEITLKWRREYGVYTHTPEYLEPEVRVRFLTLPTRTTNHRVLQSSSQGNRSCSVTTRGIVQRCICSPVAKTQKLAIDRFTRWCGRSNERQT